jgi:hypothetical protein
LRGGRKPTYLTSATSVLTSVKAVSVVPSGSDKMDVRRENTDVRWVGFHPLKFPYPFYKLGHFVEMEKNVCNLKTVQLTKRVSLLLFL